MTKETIAKNLIDFIRRSPTAYHAVATASSQLRDSGFVQLSELQHWNLERGKKYFVTRNESSLIAFTIPHAAIEGYQIIAGHSDSPLLKLKENPEMCAEGKYTKLNVEKYGGMLCAPWFDRPLSAAGRVVVNRENGIVSKLIDIEKDLLMLPSLAIHMNRNANEGISYNAQKDMLPLFACGERSFMDEVAKAADAQKEDIFGMDLYVYNRCPGTIWGAEEEFISAPRLDDLACIYGALQGLLQAKQGNNLNVLCVYDNEEVGSESRQGAASTFLKDTLEKIHSAVGSSQNFSCAVAKSFMISADNGHALHPNYTEKNDPVNRPTINGGILIKHSGNQKYTTDALSDAVMRTICKKAEISFQAYENRSDMPGGSTLGNISVTQLPIPTVDVGLPQLAMHSPYETAGVKDLQDWVRLCICFYGSTIQANENGYTIQ